MASAMKMLRSNESYRNIIIALLTQINVKLRDLYNQ